MAPQKPAPVRDGAPTIEAEELAEVTPKRRLRARSTEEDVRKSERDNFSGYSHADMHHNMVNGVSLHQRLTKDIHDRRNNSSGKHQVMGKAYYESIRQMYPSHATKLVSGLAVQDASLPMDPLLDRALEGVVARKKSFSAIQEWFENSGPPNQKVVVCVSKAMVLYVKPNTPERTEIILAHMRWAAKHGLNQNFDGECAALRETWIAACMRSLSSFKANGMTSNRWWSEHKTIGGLLVDEAACDKCMENRANDWEALEQELQVVVGANDFGYALFAMQAQRLFKRRLAKVAHEVVEEHLVGKDITDATVEAAKTIFDQKLRKLGASGDTTFPPRPAAVTYRGTELSIEVVSYNDEWKANVQALARSVGVACGKLPTMWGENDMAKYAPVAGTTVADSVVSQSKLFRESAAELARLHDATSGDEVKALFDKKRKWFHSLDRYCIIERTFFMNMVGASALAKVHQSILSALPSSTRAKTIDASVAEFRELGGSEFLRFAGASAQAVFDEANELLQALAASRIPKWPPGNSNYIKQLKDAMGYLYSAKGSEAVVLRGKAALDIQFRKVTAMEKNRGFQYSDIAYLVVYGWLLSPEQQTAVEGWSQTALAAVGKASKPAGASSSSSASSNKMCAEGKHRAQSRDELRKAVSALWT